MLAMVVNNDACLLAKRGALEPIASKLAPTESGPYQSVFLYGDDLSCASDFTPETPVPALTAREVYQPLRDAAQGICTFQRVDDACESGHVRINIDGWQLTLEVDAGHLRHCLHGQSPDGRDYVFDNGQRFGTDPVSLLSTWELAQIERLLA